MGEVCLFESLVIFLNSPSHTRSGETYTKISFYSLALSLEFFTFNVYYYRLYVWYGVGWHNSD